MDFKALEVYSGGDVSHIAGNTCETLERDPGDTDELGIIYLQAGDR